MRYIDGAEVRLGDIVEVPVPDGAQSARVVMIAGGGTHPNLDECFVNWVLRDRVLGNNEIAVQWLGDNPFAHQKPEFAPVGDIMFSPVDRFVRFVRRAEG